MRNQLCGARVALGIICGLALAGSGSAAAPPQKPPASAAAPVPTPDYHPSLGDLMTMAVQPRHIKLGLAGQRGNWTYATYELSELRNALARTGRTIPVYRNADLATLLDQMTAPPLAALEEAIKAADIARFGRAYAQLTAICNACHLSQAHAFVVIQVPDAAAYPDQRFEATAP
jgi:hypothetical protein